jgi:hypothetical protein
MRFAVVAAVVLVGCGSTTPAPFQAADAGDDAVLGDSASACPAGQTQCATCVDTKTNAMACGGCGLACATGESCCGGVCSSDPGCAFTVTSVADYRSYLAGGAYVTLKGTGFAPGLRVLIGDGRAPVRVIDGSTALVLTPPAPVGVYDVHVALGAKTASLPQSFTYRTERFGTQWVEVQMSTPRGNFPAMTTLQDGRVLIVGGTVTSSPTTTLDTGELYDPVAKKFSLAANKMSEVRNTVSAITLLDGRALIVGACNIQTGPGCFVPGDRAVADLFDPTTNTFSPTKGTLNDSTRVYMRLTLLPDGRVLVTSGSPTAELFDPATGMFTTLPVSSANGSFGFAARLRDGRVALVSNATEIYDPDSGTLTSLGIGPANGASAAMTLPDGRILLPGGATLVNGNVTPTDAIALLDVKSSLATTLAQKLSSPRLKFGWALLGNGSAMVAAGVMGPYPITYGCQSDTFPTTNAVDTIEPVLGKVTPFPPLNDNNMELVATTLLDGSILVGGGAACGGAGAYPYVYFLNSIPPPQ